MRARDLAHSTLSSPPDEVGGASATQRWIDIDLGAQILVAYEGTKPVFATLVSTGRGENATPVGVHRVGVKLRTSDMENLADEEDDDDDDRFSIEDVPYVQYFDRGVAFHGVFWHHDFGRPHSRGCVNLAPRDAARLFAFTAPHLPAGWDSAYPTELEPGTVARVRPRLRCAAGKRLRWIQRADGLFTKAFPRGSAAGKGSGPMKLGKNVFLALTAVGMADGVASDDELEALVHAARDSGVEGAELDEIKAVSRTSKGAFSEVSKLRLTPEERLFTYAIATWLVRVDGMVMPEEKMALMKLGEALRLADGDRTRASAASFKVWELDPKVRPQRFDLGALSDRIRLALAESMRPPPAW